jgi:Protein of unknown function (DUF2568)
MSTNFVSAFSLTVAFLLELIVITVYACIGVIIPGNALIRYGVAVIATITVIALWAVFAAPRSQRRLKTPWLYYFKILIFSGAAAILLMAHWIHLAIPFVLIAIFSLTLEAIQPKL